MKDKVLRAICEVIQQDVGNRGLRADPTRNLITETAGDFETACRSIANAAHPALAIVTGFYIPHAQPPCGETDGPLGALFLARALPPLGIKVVLATDAFCALALRVGLEACGLTGSTPLVVLPSAPVSSGQSPEVYWRSFMEQAGPLPHLLTHLIALERVGPSHTPESVGAQKGSDQTVVEQFLRDVPAEHRDRCYTMGGLDVTALTSPAHLLFEASSSQTPAIVTIGIGDGGNEIGMGKISWDIIRRNVPGGTRLACRVPTDQLIVSGVSNWGAYGLAAGVAILRGHALRQAFFNIERERELLRIMVEQGPLVDGLTGQATISVDGLEFERYAAALWQIGQLTV